MVEAEESRGETGEEGISAGRSRGEEDGDGLGEGRGERGRPFGEGARREEEEAMSTETRLGWTRANNDRVRNKARSRRIAFAYPSSR